MASFFTSRDRPLLHAGLLVATAASTFFTFLFARLDWHWEAAGQAVLFSGGLLAILGSHEMGHYLLARYHRVDSSLPYFIPLPGLGVGTLGAVIRLRSQIPTRNALVDIGAAGPLAGFLVAIPVLVVGILKSHVVTVPYATGLHLPGHFSVYGLVHQLVDYLAARAGHARAQDPGFNSEILGDNLFMLALNHLRFGALGPHQEVLAHPLVEAGWFGLLVTMLNLLPIGQLDGGHLTAALFGKRAEALGRIVSFIILGLALFGSVSWLVWFLVSTRLVGYAHPPVERPEEPLTRTRVLVCCACAVVLFLCIMPVPIDVA